MSGSPGGLRCGSFCCSPSLPRGRFMAKPRGAGQVTGVGEIAEGGRTCVSCGRPSLLNASPAQLLESSRSAVPTGDHASRAAPVPTSPLTDQALESAIAD